MQALCNEIDTKPENLHIVGFCFRVRAKTLKNEWACIRIMQSEADYTIRYSPRYLATQWTSVPASQKVCSYPGRQSTSRFLRYTARSWLLGQIRLAFQRAAT
jgi:hypothetical protein